MHHSTSIHGRTLVWAFAIAVLLGAAGAAVASSRASAPDPAAVVFDTHPVWLDARTISFTRSGYRLDANLTGLYAVATVTTDAREERVVERGRERADLLWSPDGKRYAYIRLRERIGPRRLSRRGDLVVADARGSALRVVVRGIAVPMGLSWSPDGTSIAFSGSEVRKPLIFDDLDLYLVAADGSGLARLTTGVGAVHPAWSPDGTHIAYVNEIGGSLDGGPAPPLGERTTVEVVTPTGTGERVFAAGRFVWSPDAQRIALRSEAGLSIQGVGGSGRIDVPARSLPTWSPDGARFAYVDDHGRLVVRAVTGKGARELGTAPSDLSAEGTPVAAFSPGGTTLAFVLPDGAVVLAGLGSRRTRVLVGPPAVPQPSRLPAATAIVWSPDGRLIAFDGGLGCERGIKLVNVRTGRLRWLTNDCRIFGSSGPDALVGTGHRDVIHGLGGDDRIEGGGGRDLVFGGPGDDRVTDRRGGVLVLGGKGDDDLRGSPGRDVLLGGPGADRLDGAGHSDRLLGGPGDDVLTGDDGPDWLQGGAGRDRLSGGDGNDALAARDRFRDEVNGGPGTDRARVDARLDRLGAIERRL